LNGREIKGSTTPRPHPTVVLCATAAPGSCLSLKGRALTACSCERRSGDYPVPRSERLFL
jgi:hypothetical protein